MTRRTLLFGSSALLAAAQSRTERGRQVIDEALAALGGERFLAMKDRLEAGRAYSFYHERLRGLSHARIYTRYLLRPEPPVPEFFGVRERQSFGKDKEDSAVLFTENEGWSITFRGARPIEKDVEERFRDSTLRNIFYILRQRLGEPGLLFEHEASDVIENQPVHVVTITDSANRLVKVYFHATTKLPVRQEWIRRNEKTRERFEELTRFAKYRDVGGVQWPYQIQRERNGEKFFEIFSENVAMNKDLKDDLFMLPSTMKVLPPAR
ncbi:MAG: hypothetical protein HY235_05100 [Acidobacteria bacterium]|nr:hypothetical protein [Acidobacteriota bacterium]